jgi:transposase
MIALPPQIRVFLYRLPTDMRKSFHGLIALTESALQQDPLSGSLFVFVNRRRDRIKILYWGQTGFCIWYQQLQQGTYQLPDGEALEQQDTIEVTRSQLSLILDGIDLGSARQRRRFQLPPALHTSDEPRPH